MIEPSDLPGVDEDLARQILAIASSSIAPGLDSISDPQRASAVAILRGVAKDARDRGSRLVKSQRVGGAGVDYTAADSWFSSDDRSALRALCGLAPGASSAPVGRFPRAGRIGQIWPEQYDD